MRNARFSHFSLIQNFGNTKNQRRVLHTIVAAQCDRGSGIGSQRQRSRRLSRLLAAAGTNLIRGFNRSRPGRVPPQKYTGGPPPGGLPMVSSEGGSNRKRPGPKTPLIWKPLSGVPRYSGKKRPGRVCGKDKKTPLNFPLPQQVIHSQFVPLALSQFFLLDRVVCYG